MATKTISKKKSKVTKPRTATPQVATRSKDPAKKLSALDAAARVLGESKEPMNCSQMIEAMAAKGYSQQIQCRFNVTPGATLSVSAAWM
jgi:hypothetical protein